MSMNHKSNTATGPWVENPALQASVPQLSSLVEKKEKNVSDDDLEKGEADRVMTQEEVEEENVSDDDLEKGKG